MKIKTLKFGLLLMALITIVISCKSDDDGDDDGSFIEEDRTEQQEKDNDSIVTYLVSHYYNSSFFETGSDYKYTDIIIEELADGETVPEGSTLLMDAVETLTTTYLEANYTYYVLNLYQGDGGSPYFTDAISVRYEGTSINDALGGEEDDFDSSVIPAFFDLQFDGTSGGVIKAWQLIMPTFNASLGFSVDENGNVNHVNPGLGVMFVPSGLAYFSGINTGSSYDNLMFKFELVQFGIRDHDNDGVPSYIEDLDNDLEVTNDDTDEDLAPNFVDADDDGDGVLTINELLPTTYTVDTNVGEVEPTLASNEFERSRVTTNGVITINTVTLIDTNDNGTPDYLDADITINYNE
ncbi:FKBP-type peptidyl-prolyl cis-trans isomerase [Winogradskyella wichelsiae]|uniref:FKBP-type peptidyl-prolyl cis-trans isomerase n=1 Tax=Winogradskyella wichelsiae TaxID=2697007 RepID=UPI0015CDE16C|nr:hypothetical protein [Winogradskyella wichelsiae]